MDADDYADPGPFLDAPPGPGVELVVLVLFLTGCLSGLTWIVYGLTH